ncbi:MAG: sister chromatid cohesion protein PDS5 [Bacteroidota bacterium]|nr:sister chromatid cohesion protein PDS5 [Bacteroidota bacterium]
MAFYDLDKKERQDLVLLMHQEILVALKKNSNEKILLYFSDEDTYIRKNAYLIIGKIYKSAEEFQSNILGLLEKFFLSKNEKVRQTAINAAGEIAMKEFGPVELLMEKGFFDEHHSVRNAVIGSIKKAGEKNPLPLLTFARKFLKHPDKEIRREICHGIELRGRTHPEDILPLLKELQHDKTSRVRNTLVHVLGQIAYKKGCLAIVVNDLKTWDNKDLVADALEEIIDVHHRYRDFAILTQDQAALYIQENYPC